MTHNIQNLSAVLPVPEPLSAEIMQLFDDYRRGEINSDEYNRRFAELQAEMDKLRMEQSCTS